MVSKGSFASPCHQRLRASRSFLTHWSSGQGLLLAACLLFLVLVSFVQLQLGPLDLNPHRIKQQPPTRSPAQQDQQSGGTQAWVAKNMGIAEIMQADRTGSGIEAVEENAAVLGPAPRMRHALWWLAPFFGSSGLGVEALSMVTALLEAHALEPHDLWLTHSGDTYEASAAAALPAKLRALVEARSPAAVAAHEARLGVRPRRAVAVCHSFFDCWALEGDAALAHPGCPCPPHPENVTYRIARTMFETERLPSHLVAHCNAMDEVWVPTEWNRAGFAASGVAAEKLRVVPEAIDTEKWDPDRTQPLQLEQVLGSAAAWATGPQSWPVAINRTRPFVFLSVGKWEARKGWSELLEAYHDTFGPDDPVMLLIVTKPFMGSGYNFADKIRQLVAERMRRGPPGVNVADIHKLARVRVLHHHLDDALFRRLYSSVHALVAPTHGEGWGRPQMEAMAMGLPVITTNWSGPTAFINDQVAYPLAIDGLVTATSSFGYFDSQHWAQPSVSHLKQLMRHVYEHHQEAAHKGRLARAHVRTLFSPKMLGKVLASELARVEAKLAVAKGMEHG